MRTGNIVSADSAQPHLKPWASRWVECYPETYEDTRVLATVPPKQRTYSAVPPKGRQSPVLVRDDVSFLTRVVEPALAIRLIPDEQR
jgi:hypothetical protein